MSERKILLQICKFVLERPKVTKWYNIHMHEKPEGKTFEQLLDGLEQSEITPYEAVVLAFMVGLQWQKKFEKETKT